MFLDSRVAVVVPAFNEEHLILKTLSAVPCAADRIFVVDDGSTDHTALRASSWDDPRIEILRHPHNLGVGAAIATGYSAAFEWGADVAVVMAGDAQMDPADFERLVLPVVRGQADYVKGDRLSHRAVLHQMPLFRWVGNHVLSFLTRVATGLDIHDTQCGYTALSRRAAAQIPLDRLWQSYGYPNDLLGWLAMAHLRVLDVTVRPIYADEQSGVGLRHACFVIPSLLLRIVLRRAAFKARERRGRWFATSISDPLPHSRALSFGRVVARGLPRTFSCPESNAQGRPEQIQPAIRSVPNGPSVRSASPVRAGRT